MPLSHEEKEGALFVEHIKKAIEITHLVVLCVGQYLWCCIVSCIAGKGEKNDYILQVVSRHHYHGVCNGFDSLCPCRENECPLVSSALSSFPTFFGESKITKFENSTIFFTTQEKIFGFQITYNCRP